MVPRGFLFIVFLCVYTVSFSQEKKERSNATFIQVSDPVVNVKPLAARKLFGKKTRRAIVNPKQVNLSKIAPGKGLPKGADPLLVQQTNYPLKNAKPPLFTFDAGFATAIPTDPTGAVGPNHYVSALNSVFSIFDKSGNALIDSQSLENIWPGETLGDPIVFYDSFADRFVITQFDGAPNSTNADNGFLIAVSQGPDPVNDGWYTYRFRTGNTFPDYPKFSIWSDGYYITANKDQGAQQSQEVVYVVERDKLIKGNQEAKIIGFPLPGIRDNGFYSPASFNAIGKSLPPVGDAKIIYMQDDSWDDVNEDKLKLWTINVDWFNPDQSFITEAEELTVANGDISPFNAVFDGGFLNNLAQPGTDVKIDAQQAVIMHATNYRRYCDYNAVALNFVVNSAGTAAIRWYELRQDGDGQPWYVQQEGTYASPDGKNAFCGSIAMDIYGNIGLGYSTVGTTANGASQDSFVSIRYTGRLADDPPGLMTFSEETFVEGTGSSSSQRYGDYAHLSVDPVDESTFWHAAEYFDSGGQARDIVGVFKIAQNIPTDVGVVSVESPSDATLGNSEIVTVFIQNFGATAQSNIPISYTVNGGTPVNEIFTGTIGSNEVVQFSFDATADLSIGNEFVIEAETQLSSDTVIINNCASKKVRNLSPNDVGVTALVSPTSGGGLTGTEEITVSITNFGGTPQSNIPVFYTLNGGPRIEEIFSGTLDVGTSVAYTFSVTADMQEFGTYTFESGTVLATDSDSTNDTIVTEIIHQLCMPTSDCSGSADGIISFQLANISNREIPCDDGYEDFSDLLILLDKTVGTYILTVQSGYVSEDAQQFSVWIDYNDNNVYEESELIVSEQVIKEERTDQNYAFTLGENATIGTHRFRIRGGDTDSNDTGNKLNDPCASMQFGTTHDYTVEIGENISSDTSIVVISEANNQFFISMSDSNADDVLRLTIYSIDGKAIATNLIEKDASSTFRYELDMSYAGPGIYFVQIGGKETGKSAKFVVN